MAKLPKGKAAAVEYTIREGEAAVGHGVVERAARVGSSYLHTYSFLLATSPSYCKGAALEPSSTTENSTSSAPLSWSERVRCSYIGTLVSGIYP